MNQLCFVFCVGWYFLLEPDVFLSHLVAQCENFVVFSKGLRVIGLDMACKHRKASTFFAGSFHS